jgi:hypothetical protein
METIYDVFRRLVAGKQLSEAEQAEALDIIDAADTAHKNVANWTKDDTHA